MAPLTAGIVVAKLFVFGLVAVGLFRLGAITYTDELDPAPSWAGARVAGK